MLFVLGLSGLFLGLYLAFTGWICLWCGPDIPDSFIESWKKENPDEHLTFKEIYEAYRIACPEEFLPPHPTIGMLMRVAEFWLFAVGVIITISSLLCLILALTQSPPILPPPLAPEPMDPKEYYNPWGWPR